MYIYIYYMYIYMYMHIWLVVWNICYFSIYVGNIQSCQLTHIFQRGWNQQPHGTGGIIRQEIGSLRLGNIEYGNWDWWMMSQGWNSTDKAMMECSCSQVAMKCQEWSCSRSPVHHCAVANTTYITVLCFPKCLHSTCPANGCLRQMPTSLPHDVWCRLPMSFD